MVVIGDIIQVKVLNKNIVWIRKDTKKVCNVIDLVNETYEARKDLPFIKQGEYKNY